MNKKEILTLKDEIKTTIRIYKRVYEDRPQDTEIQERIYLDTTLRKLFEDLERLINKK